MTIIILLFGVMLYFIRMAQQHDRPMLVVLAVSYLYYCIGGTTYWVYYQNAYFAGMLWGAEPIIWAAQILSLATVLLAGCILFITALERRRSGVVSSTSRSALRISEKMKRAVLPRAYWFLLIVGIISSIYVLANGSFSSYGLDRERSPLILIAYQFSDLLIPIIAYTIAVRGYSKAAVAMIVYFTFYVVLVGFRYKLAILFIPILADQLLNTSNQIRRYLVLGLTGFAGLVLFALMTLYRTKFGIPDFSVRLEHPSDDLVYGLFAESNVLFGLSSILRAYADTGNLYTLDPIADVFKEWLPRLLFPDRVTGAYLIPMQNGFSTLAGISSGTSYPWIGEFVIMFGYLGIVLGAPILAMLYVYLRNKVRRHSSTRRQYIVGLALLAAMIGFYHYSRGYFPQIVKAYIFVIVPYMYLCYVSSRRRISVSGRPRRQFSGGLLRQFSFRSQRRDVR